MVTRVLAADTQPPMLGLGSAADEGRKREVEKRSALFAAARVVLTAAAGRWGGQLGFLQEENGVLGLGYNKGEGRGE